MKIEPRLPFTLKKLWRKKTKSGTTPRRLTSSVFVDFATVADFEHQNDQPVLLDAADQAVVAYSITPQAGEMQAQRLADVLGIFHDGDAFAQVTENGFLNLGVEFAKLAARAVVELDCPHSFVVTF